MNAGSRSTPSWVKWVCLFAGLLLLLGGLAWLGWNGWLAWGMWKAQHVKDKPVPANALMSVFSKYGTNLVEGAIGFFVGLWLVRMGNQQGRTSLVDEAKALQNSQSMQLVPAAELAPVAQPRAKAKRWASANVLAPGLDNRKLWNFKSTKAGFTVEQQANIPSAQPLPSNLVGRSWRNLEYLSPKLNIAWLPVEQVFLRVVQLPQGNHDETIAMVELQLERLSPLPVTQIVWSVEILSQQVDNQQTVIVIIVARDIVEKFLGELEGQGFLASRLELPILDELLSTRITNDGAYVYPYSDPGKFSALVAWWYGGTLRSLSLVHVPMADNRAEFLKEQLAQMAWAGEVEGWLTSGEPRWHLVANDANAANWQPMFQPWLGKPVEALAPLSETDLATRNANRAARAESGTGLLPAEYALRYDQEFHDRLWIRGLGAIVVVYLLGVMVYMVGSMYKGMAADDLDGHMKGLAREYTNTLQIKAQVEILQNRQALKFASLDCWKTTAELLPAGITLGSLEFRDGKTLNLSGSAPGDGNGTLTDFNEAMRKATLNGKPMFEQVSLPNVRLNPGGSTLSWSFNATLANAEEIQ